MDWRHAQHGSGVNAAFKVRYTDAARDDLLRLFDLLLDRAQTAEDFGLAQCAIDTITLKVESNLSRSPFIFRKAGQSPFLRELVITSGSSGYVALHKIPDARTVNILAVRHQLQGDYH